MIEGFNSSKESIEVAVNEYPRPHESLRLPMALEERGSQGFIWQCLGHLPMAAVKPIISAILGILLIAALFGYTVEYDKTGIPQPDAGVTGVTKEAFSDVPSSGPIIDIDVAISWSSDQVWIGIISVEEYDRIGKAPGNEEANIVTTDPDDIEYVAGGPGISGQAFEWQPNGEPFHIVLGSVEGDGGGGGGGGGDPWPFDGEASQQSFTGEFDIYVNADVSGGWVVILILLIGELGALYVTVIDN
jgi:hypothetical protein